MFVPAGHARGLDRGRAHAVVAEEAIWTSSGVCEEEIERRVFGGEASASGIWSVRESVGDGRLLLKSRTSISRYRASWQRTLLTSPRTTPVAIAVGTAISFASLAGSISISLSISISVMVAVFPISRAPSGRMWVSSHSSGLVGCRKLRSGIRGW